MKETILLIDDNVNDSIKLTKDLKKQGFEVISCNNGKSGINMLEDDNNNISLILLDVIMPKMDGLTFLSELKSKNYDIPVIMFTSINHDTVQKICFNMGINDYIVKPCYIGLLIKKIRLILDERVKLTEFNNKLWIYDNIKINFCTKEVLWNDNEVSLGKTALEILKFLVCNRGIVLSREQIINRIWGNCCEINGRTVDAHISKIRTTLDLDCLKSIPGYGYILDC